MRGRWRGYCHGCWRCSWGCSERGCCRRGAGTSSALLPTSVSRSVEDGGPIDMRGPRPGSSKKSTGDSSGSDSDGSKDREEKKRKVGESKDANPELHVPGGYIKYSPKLQSLIAHCEVHKHEKCTLSKQVVVTETYLKRCPGAGRPMGLLIAWLARAARVPYCGCKEEHKGRYAIAIPFEERDQAPPSSNSLPKGWA